MWSAFVVTLVTTAQCQLVTVPRSDAMAAYCDAHPRAATGSCLEKTKENKPPFSTCTRSHCRPREREGEWTRNWNIRTGPACKAGDHTRADPKTAQWGGRADVVELRDGQ